MKHGPACLAVLLLVGLQTAQAADQTWDHDADGTASDGSGTWLDSNQWLDGVTPATWSSGDRATIGSGGSGGTLTLGAVVADTVTFTSFTGTYTLNSGSLTNSGGITTAAGAGNVTINTPIGGAGGLTKNGASKLTLTQTANNYTGPTVVNGGILQLGTGYRNTHSIPGGLAGSPSGSNLELNGGTITIWWPFTRGIGPDPEHIQITGGESGFSFMQYDRGGQISFAGGEVVWGSPYFNPEVLILNEAAANPQQIARIDNGIDLNGTNRTVTCNSTKNISAASGNGYMGTAGGRLLGVIRNSGAAPAGLIKIGPGELQLTAANTYEGATQVKAGTLSIYGGNNRIPAGSTLILGDAATDAGVTFKLHGYSQLLSNGLTTAGTGTNRIINGRSTEVTLTLDVAAGTNQFDGILGGPGANDNSFALTKRGAGTLSLTASNSYSGQTLIEGGTLSVAGPFFSDDAPVIMAAGTTCVLDFSGTDTVHSLVLGDEAATAGTWGGVGSGADHTSGQLSGSGRLYVDGTLPAYYWDGPNTGGVGNAASDGGSGTWDTSTVNWDRGLGSRVGWSSSTNAKAVFGTTYGTVTLGDDITLAEMDLQGAWGTQPYVFESNTLQFAGARLITSDNIYLTFKSGITGSPTVNYESRGGDNNSALRFEPAGTLTMTLGTVNVTKDMGNQRNASLFLGGESSGNSAEAVTWSGGAHQLTIFKRGASTWTVDGFSIHGDCRVDISAGTLVANGRWNPTHEIDVNSGGTLSGTGILSVTRTGPTEHVRVLAGGTVAPGNPVGTMTITNDNCTIAGTLAVSFSGAQCSQLAVDGDLDISAGTSALEVNPAGASGGEFVIATYNSLIGTFSTNNLPSSWTIDYGPTQITLTPPPAGSVFIVR